MQQAQKTALITGATSGIGKATVLALAKQGLQVVLVARNLQKGQAALEEIRAKTGNSHVDVLIADLSSQQAIRQLADEFIGTYQRLHVLVNNAAVNLSKPSLTVDGLETTFAVNHLAPFLLTNLLLDVLKASAPARIINVTSSGQSRFHRLRQSPGRKRLQDDAGLRAVQTGEQPFHL